jgi:hypothetical protein
LCLQGTVEFVGFQNSRARACACRSAGTRATVPPQLRNTIPLRNTTIPSGTPQFHQEHHNSIRNTIIPTLFRSSNFHREHNSVTNFSLRKHNAHGEHNSSSLREHNPVWKEIPPIFRCSLLMEYPTCRTHLFITVNQRVEMLVTLWNRAFR